VTTNHLNIEPPDDFERSTMVRSWLSSLPEPAVPAGFEEAVLGKAKASTEPTADPTFFSRFGVPLGIVAVLVSIVSVWYFTSQPDVVRVVRVPDVATRTVDLYNLTPAPVREMPPTIPMRGQKASKPRKLHGVAGY
jgi:hypothetical protein